MTLTFHAGSIALLLFFGSATALGASPRYADNSAAAPQQRTVFSLSTAARLANHGDDRVLLPGDGSAIALSTTFGLDEEPVAFVSDDGSLNMRGAGGSYVLTDDRGTLWRFEQGRAVARRERDRPWADVVTGSSPAAVDGNLQCDAACDTAASPAPEGFANGPTVPGASTLDARPANCRSYFGDYPPIERGTRIESGIALLSPYTGSLATPRSFPSIDFVSDTELIAVRSRDLAARTYGAGPVSDALYRPLMRDGADIDRRVLQPLAEQGRLVHVERGQRFELSASPPRAPVLELVVRHGLASPAQIAEIERARLELAATYGIELRLIEIP